MSEPRSEQWERLEGEGGPLGDLDLGIEAQDDAVVLIDPDGDLVPPGDVVDTEGTAIARDALSEWSSGPEDRAMHIERE